MSDPVFRDADEFREVLDRMLSLISRDDHIGRRLRDADVPERYEVTDLEVVLNIRAATFEDEGDGHLRWAWTNDVDWDPVVSFTMASPVMNRFFQGRENVAVAIARRRIRASGRRGAALALLPVLKPLFPEYRAMIETDYPHLVV